MPPFALVASVLLGALFLVGAAGKARDFARFAATVNNYRLLPDALATAAAGALLLAELGAGLAALSAALRGTGTGLLPAAFLLALYAGAMGINLLRGRTHIDCGCSAFGGQDDPIGAALVARNLMVAAVALLLAAAPWQPRPLAPAEWISALGAIIALPLLWHAFGQLVSLHHRTGALRT